MPPGEHGARIDGARAEMERRGIDYLLVGPSSDLVYLTGYELSRTERMSLLVLPLAGTPQLILPSFELVHITGSPALLEPLPWTDGDDPVALLSRALPARGRGVKLAIGWQLPARFLFEIQAALPAAGYENGDLVLEPVRTRKSAREIALLRAASQAADSVFDELLGSPLVGKTEREIEREVCRLLEATSSKEGGAIVAVGSNSATIDHHASDRRLERGEGLLLDFGGVRSGYCSDSTRTMHAGAPPPEFTRVYDTVLEAQARALASVRPGVTPNAVDAAARELIVEAGYGSFFTHRTGHGIGIDGHEAPYLVSGGMRVLEEGMTMTIEPGIYLPDRFGVRIEDIAVVTADGADLLTRSTRSLQVL